MDMYPIDIHSPTKNTPIAIGFVFLFLAIFATAFFYLLSRDSGHPKAGSCRAAITVPRGAAVQVNGQDLKLVRLLNEEGGQTDIYVCALQLGVNRVTITPVNEATVSTNIEVRDDSSPLVLLFIEGRLEKIAPSAAGVLY